MADSTHTIHVDVVSAEESIFSGEARFVALPGEAGELGIFPRHTPLITRVKPGSVRIEKADGTEEFVFVAGGILEVQPNRVTVLSDTAIRGKDLDEEKANEARRSAEEALKIALADASVLMVNRNVGSGTRVLMDNLLDGARPVGYANQPKSHNAVAAAIAQGRADWGLAIEPVAKLYGLGFLPVEPEHYDFLIADARRSRPAVQAFIDVLHDETTRERIRALGMQPAD